MHTTHLKRPVYLLIVAVNRSALMGAITSGFKARDLAAGLESGERLVVASRRNPADNADLYLLSPAGPEEAEARRRPLTETAGLDESQPTVSPDGRHVVFVRRDQLFRLDLAQGRERHAQRAFGRRHADRGAGELAGAQQTVQNRGFEAVVHVSLAR